MRLDALLPLLQREECMLADHLRQLSGRHTKDPEVRDLALDLADWSTRHADDLEPWAGPPQECAWTGWGPTPVPGLELIDDLCSIHRHATDVELRWELVGLAARALHDHDLIEVVERSRAQTERQIRWAAAQTRQSATQTLVTG